jgi:hypothetical protein
MAPICRFRLKIRPELISPNYEQQSLQLASARPYAYAPPLPGVNVLNWLPSVSRGPFPGWVIVLRSRPLSSKVRLTAAAGRRWHLRTLGKALAWRSSVGELIFHDAGM